MEELVEKAKKGDKEAFTTLILSKEKELYSIAKVRLRNNEDIYDAVQETILMAFKSIKKLKQVEFFNRWIIKILINESNKIYNQKNKRKVVSLEEARESEVIDLSNIDNIEVSLDLNSICKKLKYEDRMIIILYYVERFTDKEIGEILNLKEETTKTKRTRAKQKIKKIIEERNQEKWIS